MLFKSTHCQRPCLGLFADVETSTFTGLNLFVASMHTIVPSFVFDILSIVQTKIEIGHFPNLNRTTC